MYAHARVCTHASTRTHARMQACTQAVTKMFTCWQSACECQFDLQEKSELSQRALTLAQVLRPQALWKIYCWRRKALLKALLGALFLWHAKPISSKPTSLTQLVLDLHTPAVAVEISLSCMKRSVACSTEHPSTALHTWCHATLTLHTDRRWDCG